MADEKSLDIGSKKWQYGRSPAMVWLQTLRHNDYLWDMVKPYVNEDYREEVVKMKRVVKIVDGVKIWEDDMIKEPKVGMRVKVVDARCTFGRYENGDIGVLDEKSDPGWFAIFPNQNQRSYIKAIEYIIIGEGTMKTFKAGDKVVMTKANSDHYVNGDLGTIIEKAGLYWRVNFGSDRHYVAGREMEVVKMKTLAQKIADALTPSRQKWVKYPKELVKSNDPCGFCDEFRDDSPPAPCKLCQELVWGGEQCMDGVCDCDSTDDYWAEACDIMQAKFDKIEAMGFKINRLPYPSVAKCLCCGDLGAEYGIGLVYDKFFCKSCLSKLNIDLSEYDVKETPSKNAAECSKHPSRGLCSDDCANYVPKHASEVEKSFQVKKEAVSVVCRWLEKDSVIVPYGYTSDRYDGMPTNEYIQAKFKGKATKLTIELLDD